MNPTPYAIRSAYMYSYVALHTHNILMEYNVSVGYIYNKLLSYCKYNLRCSIDLYLLCPCAQWVRISYDDWIVAINQWHDIELIWFSTTLFVWIFWIGYDGL